jgi:carbamoyltransferase
VLLRPDGSISIPLQLIPERAPDADIQQIHGDVAAALQESLETAMLHICRHLSRKTRLRQLALAGGVALNCTANSKLLKSGFFDGLYTQPAAGDDGAALGAALLRSARREEVKNRRMPAPFLGPAYTAGEINESIQRFRDHINVKRFGSYADACDAAAALIADGCVIAWYRGRMEFGPRALGNRSILADPGRPEMRDRINAMVKMREAFRPFAPAATIEIENLLISRVSRK